MLRAIGCQGGRTPLLIQEGDGAFAPGGSYRTLIPNPESLVGSGGSYDVAKSEIWSTSGSWKLASNRRNHFAKCFFNPSRAKANLFDAADI